jgi:hypothetical protein
VNILEAMTDPQIFGKQFAGDSWAAWRTLLAGFYGLPIPDPDLWQQLTQRPVEPSRAHSELWLPVGRRAGKSHIAALLAVYEAVFNDHEERLSPGEVATVMVIACDRKQARTVMRYTRGLFETSPILSKLVWRDREESIELTNRCAIEVQTATHRGTRGYTVACAILDEIAFWLTDGRNPDSEILAALRPSMASLNGRLIALSSPYARRGVLWDAYKKHYGQDSRILVAQAESRLMNPLLPQSIVDEAYRDDPLSAAAEYGAQFRTDVESFVTLEAVERVTRPSQLEIMPDTFTQYKAFVDPSGGSSDAMTLCVAHRDPKTGVAVINCTRKVTPPFSPENVVEEFAVVLRNYRCHEVTGDRYAGEWPREQFVKRGIRYVTSSLTKSEIYQALLPLVNSEKISLPPDPQLQRELLGLERRTSRAGRDLIDHSPGAHDDLINSVAGAAVLTVAAVPRAFFGGIKVAGL